MINVLIYLSPYRRLSECDESAITQGEQYLIPRKLSLPATPTTGK
jgi:hypothetical protein